MVYRTKVSAYKDLWLNCNYNNNMSFLVSCAKKEYQNVSQNGQSRKVGRV